MKEIAIYLTNSFLLHIETILNTRSDEYLNEQCSFKGTNKEELLGIKDNLESYIAQDNKEKPTFNIIKEWAQRSNYFDYETYDFVPYTRIFSKRLLIALENTKEAKDDFKKEIIKIFKSFNYEEYELNLNLLIDAESTMREIIREVVYKFDVGCWEKYLEHSRIYHSSLVKYFQGVLVETSQELKFINSNLELKVEEKNKELLENIYFDKVTGLPNINSFNRDLETNKGFITLLNIEGFRKINSLYGFDFGDKVLKKVAHNLSDLIKDTNSRLYKLNGDWYVIFNINMNQFETINIVNDINKHFEDNYIKIEKEKIFISFLMGVTKKLITPLRYAEMAMHSAREKNLSYLIYNDSNEVINTYKKQKQWLEKIKNALKKDLFIPYFQLIRDNQNPSIQKYETLVRLEDEDGKVYSPYYFLEIAKHSKLYPQITRKMITKASQKFSNINGEFSINLEVEDILDSSTMDYIYNTIIKYKVENKVIFEITESESIYDFSKISAILQRFRKLGVRFAIDDFGTGYSNFSYLAQLNFDYLKIDGSLIKNIHTNQNSKKITEVIVNFAKEFNLKTIAEFVEDEDTQTVIEELGIDYTQGYLFSQPQQELLKDIK